MARSLLVASGWILLWLPGLITTDDNRAWLVCIILGLGCVLLLVRYSVVGRIRAMIQITLILLTAYWASDVTWAAGWQQRVLGWPERSGGIAPFAGPVAIWLIVFVVLTVVSVLLGARGIRKLQADLIEMAGLFTLSAASAVTCWYLYDRIGGV